MKRKSKRLSVAQLPLVAVFTAVCFVWSATFVLDRTHALWSFALEGVTEQIPGWIAHWMETTRVRAAWNFDVNEHWPFSPEQAQTIQERTAKQLGLPAALRLDVNATTPLEFVLIPPGIFWMGSPMSELLRLNTENTLTRVKVEMPFYMGKHEVSQSQYRSLTGTNPSFFCYPRNSSDLPVEMLTWHDCKNLLVSAMNERIPLGWRARLPRKTEWEYACRAGSNEPFAFGDKISTEWANYSGLHETADGVEIYGKNSKPSFKTVPVMSGKPNAWGLVQMHGNVSEWCEDTFSPNMFSPVNLMLHAGKKYRVLL
jgi:formylglycine-generating enzyme required for sulfatase activity